MTLPYFSGLGGQYRNQRDDPYNSDASISSVNTGGCGGFGNVGTVGCSSSSSSGAVSSCLSFPTSLSVRNNATITIGQQGGTTTRTTNTNSSSSNNNGKSTDPSSKQYASEAEALMVKELTQLSLKERNNIEEEIHGCGDEIDETPQLIEESLVNFQIELDQIIAMEQQSYQNHHSSTTPPPPSNILSSAYQQALKESPDFVADRQFRLMFLRADRFDVGRAVKRFLKYYQALLENFGPQQLSKKDIAWEDLSEEDQNCVKTCSFWIGNKDQKGRRLVWIFPQYEIYDNYKNQIRNVFYQIMHALKDEESQRKGFIKVVYYIGGDKSRMKPPSSQMDTEFFFKGITLIFECLPFRLAALHYCFDGPTMRPVIATVQYVIGKAGRLRFRAHYGSHIECQYRLMTFGIPKGNIPISDTGDVPTSMNHFYAYLEELRQHEQSNHRNNNTLITSSNTHTFTPPTSPPPTGSDAATDNHKKKKKKQKQQRQESIIHRSDTPTSSTIATKLDSSTMDTASRLSAKGNSTSSNVKGSISNSKIKISDSSKSTKTNALSTSSSSKKNSKSNIVANDDVGITPSTKDVLLGRGRPFQEYPGNVRLAILVDRYRERYMEAGRCDKAIISQHLVDQIKNADGRFLKKLTSDGPWVEVSDEVARDKVGHGFRTKPRKIFNNNNNKSSSSLTSAAVYGGGGGGGNNINNQQQYNNANNRNHTFRHQQQNINMNPTATPSMFMTNIGSPTSASPMMASMAMNQNMFGGSNMDDGAMMMMMMAPDLMMSHDENNLNHHHPSTTRF